MNKPTDLSRPMGGGTLMAPCQADVVLTYPDGETVTLSVDAGTLKDCAFAAYQRPGVEEINERRILPTPPEPWLLTLTVGWCDKWTIALSNPGMFDG